MKRFWTITVMAAAMMLAGCTKEAAAPSDSDILYGSFASRGDLTVAQVKGFRVNDTLSVDVVLLVADNSAAWQRLKEEFDIRAEEGITSWLGDIERPQTRVGRNVRPVWRAMAVHDEHTLAFYRVDSDADLDALRRYQMGKVKG